MRNTILNTIITDIPRITIANGYKHDAPEASKYFSTLDDISSAPHINIYCGAQQSLPMEPGLETILKVNILTHAQVNTDINKEGLLTSDVESWLEDYIKFFTYPSTAEAEESKICTLWSVAGVTYYFISAIEPYYDRNDNRHTIFVELTVNFLQIT
ncbi:MAG TPA: hypothetical protein VGK25_09080 [Ignavibacteria bacterium]|jgi:hypothetical protein